MEPHDCMQSLKYLGWSSTVEPHGERFTDDEWRCTKCGQRITENDIRRAKESNADNR